MASLMDTAANTTTVTSGLDPTCYHTVTFRIRVAIDTVAATSFPTNTPAATATATLAMDPPFNCAQCAEVQELWLAPMYLAGFITVLLVTLAWLARLYNR
ncbi:uncharacterized protein F5Z01DRAFT_675035 [Emericellopsis atlantica]|uniref:Uncharacterized protein n=1 Tax=Emericellopsis atlantica TaxID=2614577 RepID=A0A9P7ZKF1_9HYPO|nr:uncharacterized protein F5Z01DRAFT_675035 [Emericellopsis atlantica]KAG9253630.1 hypothetical protein F5Z01DRAFT_675035 [Emericellopsis atlantica]